METARKIDHSKDEYYLTFAMRGPNYDSKICPLDDKRIKDGYIEAEGTESHGIDNSNKRKFKCFSLHPIVDGCDILEYTYGNIGYDLNPESMRVYVGGWRDLLSNNTANNLANNQKLLSDKKHGNSYFGNNKVDKVMNKKVLNRAKLLRETIKKSKSKNPQEILQAMFGASNKKDDDSFYEGNYHLEKEGNIWKLTGNKVDDNTKQEFHSKHGVNIGGNFELIYDEENDKIYFTWGNELNGVGTDKKGIKVDRIFVKERNHPDYGLLDLQDLQNKARKKKEQIFKDIYDNYINKLTDVLIKQFPFGEIRVVKGDVKTGQKNVFLSPEEFINQYVNDKDKGHYLQELDKIRKYKIAKQYNPNVIKGCYMEPTQQQTPKARIERFQSLLNCENLQVIKNKLGQPKVIIDKKSNKYKIFPNNKWYNRAHWTEKGIVRHKINRVFNRYVLGDINDDEAIQDLSLVVYYYRRFFNSIYC